MLNQSFRQVFVTNTPALLPSGSTVENIAVGQIGIIDAKTHVAVTTPTYGNNKAIKLVWGTPDIEAIINYGFSNQNEYSKLIKGNLIRNFRGKAAHRGQHQIVTVGFSGGVSDTDTLFSKPGQHRELFINLSGGAIDKEYSLQGIQRRYFFKKDVVDDCVDTCVDIDPREIAESLVKQINADKTINRYVKASSIIECDPDLDAPTTRSVYKFRLSVIDAKDGASLAAVQSQYSGYGVKRIGEEGLASVYEVTRTVNTLPTAYSNLNASLIIPECTTCPSGYTLINTGFAYKVIRNDAGDETAKQTVGLEFGIDDTEKITRVGYEFGQSTYVIASDAALGATAVDEVQSIVATGASAGTFTLTFEGQTTSAIAYNASAATVGTALAALSNLTADDFTAAGGPLPTTPVTITFKGARAGQNVSAITANSGSLTGGTAVITTPTPGVALSDGLTSLGEIRQSCVLTSPTTTAWVADDVLVQYAKTYRLTIGDTICGETRLTDLQAAYPDNVVTLVDAGGTCVHTYEITTYSNSVLVGCSVDEIVYTKPQSFEGSQWVATPAEALEEGTTCKAGIKLEVAVVNRQTNECTFDRFPYDAEAVFIEVSSGNADYMSNVPLENEWVVKNIQGVKFPAGVGAYVRKLEKDSLSYALKERSFDPIVREIEGYEFQAKSGVFYDEYVLEFDFSYKVGGWSQTYTDSYSLFLYFPEGQGKAFEAAVNTYLASTNISIDPVIL